MLFRSKERGIEVVDITVRSGDRVFAPSWEMVRSVKNVEPKQMAAAEIAYREDYRKLMLASYRENQAEWLALLNKPKIALACYCPVGKFCHRHLLVDFLKAVARKHNIPIVLHGELTNNKGVKNELDRA